MTRQHMEEEPDREGEPDREREPDRGDPRPASTAIAELPDPLAPAALSDSLAPAALSDPLAPAAIPGPVAVRSAAATPAGLPAARWVRPHHTWQQIIGGLLLIGACVLAAVWYVPRVLANNRNLLSGSVVSSGVDTLNFTSAGEIDRIDVRTGEHVHKGQVLATEYAPNIAPLLAADAAAIDADKARIATVSVPVKRPGYTVPVSQAAVAAAKAQLKLDEAQLATDRLRLTATRIIAPAAGTVIAANGRPGEAVTTAGIRDYASDNQRAASAQRPLFSLIPEGPQSTAHAASASALPVIALRTSSAWQVAALVGEGSVSRLSQGEPVTISVPAAHLARVPGRISELLSDPVATSQGTEYQVLVKVDGHVRAPWPGMAADITLRRAAQPAGS